MASGRPVPAGSMIYDGAVDDYERLGELVMREQLLRLGGLRPTDTVLDVG